MQNTAQDLRDCVYAIEEGEYADEISRSEQRALAQIVELAHQIVNDLEYEIDDILELKSY
jgi:hypothetical protein